jgi:glycosyltransferase involved in cell wall biosynthesis
MKIIMDFRKYDGVVGGVEQGAIQITRYMCGRGDQVILACKQNKCQEIKELLGDLNGLTVLPLTVRSHMISIENMWLDSVFLQDLAEKEEADLIHFYYNWGFPFRRKVPCVLTVHDVIPFTFREAMGLLQNRLVYRPSLQIACRLNDVIVTVSEYSMKDIAKKIRIPIGKIRVIPNGSRDPAAPDPKVEADLKKKFGLEAGYVLNVGGIHERKNIARLIQAFAKMTREADYSGILVITGSVSGAPYQERMKKLCDAAVVETGMQNRVVFTGFVAEKELDMLLRRADLFVYPSLYEGFGIPILEAMKLGTPVVASNATAIPEISGDAAVLVDPRNVDEMAAAMARLLSDNELRQILRSKGMKRAERFSWRNTCDEYSGLYEEVTSFTD